MAGGLFLFAIVSELKLNLRDPAVVSECNDTLWQLRTRLVVPQKNRQRATLAGP